MSHSDFDPQIVSSLGRDGPLKLTAARQIGAKGTGKEIEYEVFLSHA